MANTRRAQNDWPSAARPTPPDRLLCAGSNIENTRKRTDVRRAGLSASTSPTRVLHRRFLLWKAEDSGRQYKPRALGAERRAIAFRRSSGSASKSVLPDRRASGHWPEQPGIRAGLFSSLPEPDRDSRLPRRRRESSDRLQ